VHNPSLPRKPRLTTEQIELVGQFNDGAYDNSGLTFHRVAEKIVGARPFPSTLAGRKFKRLAKEVFDRERQRLAPCRAAGRLSSQ
jgi:hypothetical protein